LARQDQGCERLMTVPGIGPIISSATVAAIGTGDAHERPRLRRLARARAETAIDRRPHDPRQHIEARQSLSAQSVRSGRLGRADRFHRFLEVDRDDLLVDPRFPDYATDRTDRFMVVELVISSGRPTGIAATIADEAVRLFGERLHLAPQDILFVFYEVEPNLPRFPAASIRRDPTADA
jgi:hypothetical protein